MSKELEIQASISKLIRSHKQNLVFTEKLVGKMSPIISIRLFILLNDKLRRVVSEGCTGASFTI